MLGVDINEMLPIMIRFPMKQKISWCAANVLPDIFLILEPLKHPLNVNTSPIEKHIISYLEKFCPIIHSMIKVYLSRAIA